MANSREAQFQWDFIEAMTAYGCKAGTVGGYDRKMQGVSEVGAGKPHDPEKQRLADIIDRHNDLNGAEASDKLRFSKCVTGHQGSRKVSMLLLEDEETGRFLILKLLAGRLGRNEQPGK